MDMHPRCWKELSPLQLLAADLCELMCGAIIEVHAKIKGGGNPCGSGHLHRPHVSQGDEQLRLHTRTSHVPHNCGVVIQAASVV